MTSNLMSLGVTDLLLLMEKRKISAKEYAVELSEKLSSEDHLNAVQSFSKDLLFESADIADRKRQSGSGGGLCGIPFIAKDNINSKNFEKYSLKGVKTSIHVLKIKQFFLTGRKYFAIKEILKSPLKLKKIKFTIFLIFPLKIIRLFLEK